jgi:predicted methyltransferase
VLLVLFYHDTVWMKTDRAKLNASVFNALKKGGVYGAVDHSARAGDGIEQVQTLHRIEEQMLRDEIIKAGFVLAGESSILRNPDDTRDWNASPSDRGRVVVLGYDSYDSYAYPGGLDQKIINPLN